MTIPPSQNMYMYNACILNCLYTKMAWNYKNRSLKNNETRFNLKSMAIDAYIYGYPLVTMDVTRKNLLSSGSQINQFYNERTFPTPQFTTVVAPNVDTLYSSAWLDLSKEPIVLHVPDTLKTYYVLEILDAWTNVFSAPGTRTTGNKANNFVIIGPQWKGTVPNGITRINAPTNSVWIINRIQTNGPKDYLFINDLQDNFTLTPLRYNGLLTGNIGRTRIGTSKTSTKSQVDNMDAATFFSTMMNTMYINPPYPAIIDPEMNKKLFELGLVPSKNFDFFKLKPSVQYTLEYANVNGPKLIKIEDFKAIKNNSTKYWNIVLKDIGYYGTHYMQRAIIAMFVLGANLPQDAVYGSNYVDSNGKPLDGKNSYIIRLKKGQIPPVNAFWSITLYNLQGFLVENPINRFAISSHIGNLSYNADGSLNIYIQNALPEKHQETNWLPSPKGSFYLMIRMYWPKQRLFNGEWQPPAIIPNY